MTVHGHVDERFSALSEVLDAQLESGEELGAAISVNLGGQTLVDVWGGYADAARTIPWGEDTIVNVWSTTKEITALAILMLVEQGLVDLDAPVATYWPEFAQHGKHDILVKQVMSHTSGVSGWDQPFVAEDMYDWEKSTSRLAAQAPRSLKMALTSQPGVTSKAGLATSSPAGNWRSADGTPRSSTPWRRRSSSPSRSSIGMCAPSAQAKSIVERGAAT